jgi:drug/metabolite transporter (DMT)-like permease
VGTADSTLRVVAVQQAYALAFAVLLLGGVSAIGGAPLPVDATPAAWASAVASGLLYYATAYWLYLSGLRGVPASIAAVSFYLIPVFGIAAGAAFLAERFDVGQWVGVGIVLVAVSGIVGRPVEAGR